LASQAAKPSALSRPLSPFGYFLQKEKKIGKEFFERDFAE